MVRKVLILIGVVLAMSACGRAPGIPARIPQASDSLYTAQAALKVYGTQPDQALAIIDSALVIGNVSPFRADFLRAMVYANSVERPQLNKAISLCENLLKQDSTQVVDKPTFDNRNNVLGVMLDACRKKEDDENWLRYAVERAELSRAHGMETEALRMEAEIGAALTRLGRREEGLIKLEQVIRALDQGAPSIDRMDAGIGGGENGKGADVTITGGIVEAHAGENEEYYKAIGPGRDNDDYGSLTLGDQMMVRYKNGNNWSEPVPVAYEHGRKAGAWYHTEARIEPCTHPGYEGHPENCPYHVHP